MKFSRSVDINLSRQRVIELFDNPDNMQYWQDGFVSFDHIAVLPDKQELNLESFIKMANET
jgi:hypothetical protein